MNESPAFAASPVESAETRNTIYQMLAIGWRYPTREAFAAYKSGQYMEELLELASTTPHLVNLAIREDDTARQARSELAATPFEAFEVGYVMTFDAGYPEPPCPPYEGLYNKNMERAAAMVEVSQFYRHFGLTMNQDEDKRELPDYLCAELEFLAFLTFQETRAAEAGEEELLNGYRWAQRDFLQRHMVDWLPAFAARLEREADLPFYVHLARFTIAFTRAELKLLSALVRANGHQPADITPPGDQAMTTVPA